MFCHMWNIYVEDPMKSTSELQQLSNMIQDRWKALTSGEVSKSKKVAKAKSIR